MAKNNRRCFYDEEVYPNLFSVIFKDYQTKEYFTFYIYHWPDDSSKNVNQLPQLLAFVRKQCDWLIGYNNKDYDDLILNYCFIHERRLLEAEPSMVCMEIYNLNQQIIQHQRADTKFADKYLLTQKEFFYSIDLILQFNTIDRVGLKQLAINLRHNRIQDLPIKPGTWIKPDQVEGILSYNHNDVDITEKVFKNRAQAINDRMQIGAKLGVDVINKCDTDIAKTVLAKYYEEGSKIPYKVFSKSRTFYEGKINLGELISKKVRFQTPYFGKIIKKLHGTNVDPNKRETKGKKKKQFEHIFASKYLTHTMGLGGLHSNNPSQILQETEDYFLIDLDVSSYYPWLIILELFFPAHLGPIFIEIYRQKIVNERMTAKRAGDAVLALMLKYAANSTFGLTKSIHSWLYDPKVTYGTTINGELFLMMLIEGLELYSDCVVVYSNTDGLTVRVPKYHYTLFHQICNRWMVMSGLELEFSRYKKMYMQDVNNYLIFTYDKKKPIKAKGSYTLGYDSALGDKNEKEVTKGYDCPIISLAVRKYLNENVPVEDTIYACNDIYDFMSSERTSDKKFKVYLYERAKPTSSEPTVLQKNNRWIVTKNNPHEGKLVKIALEPNEKGEIEKTEMHKGSMVTIFNDVPDNIKLEEVFINYEYYIIEAKSMITLKPADRETYVVDTYTQPTLFE